MILSAFRKKGILKVVAVRTASFVPRWVGNLAFASSLNSNGRSFSAEIKNISPMPNDSGWITVLLTDDCTLLLIRVHKPGEGGRVIYELAEKLGLAPDAT